MRQALQRLFGSRQAEPAALPSPPPAPPIPSPPATWVPPGHHYSPIVDLNELHQNRHIVFDRSRDPTGIDLQENQQLSVLHALSAHHSKLPFKAERQDGLRYFYENPAYSYGDAIVLASMLLEAKPERIVEFGSGYSSCLFLDINELHFANRIECSFVEPHPELLFSLMKPEDQNNCRIFPCRAQDVPLSVVDSLNENDIVFIDSTHVSKAGSDVNFHIFTLLPRLKSGVYVHFHDIFFPFEYPEDWFFGENRSWNEIYLLHAFLMGNTDFEIIFFNHFMHVRHGAETEAALPMFSLNPGGSLWLRRR